MMKRIKWYNKLIILGGLIILMGNPLSLSFMADGVNVAVLFVADAIEFVFRQLIDFTLTIIGIGVMVLVLGVGARLGAEDKIKTAKLKKSKGSKDGMKYEIAGAK